MGNRIKNKFTASEKHISMKKIALFILFIGSAAFLSGQTANKTIGCNPLQVEFTSPDLSTYFWRFGNGNVSEDKDPTQDFTEPGVYTVELFEGTAGPKIGEVVITVLAPPDIRISASDRAGCSPFLVEFTNESIVDPNLNVTGYLWSFGDGNGSNDENPTHIYTKEGTFDVSLRIESDLENCQITETFEDFIMVSGSISAEFIVDNSVVCSAPATINITNTTVSEPEYTYLWDFGNGETSTEYNPPPVNYTEEGNYIITLTIDNGDGCVVTLTRTISVGEPEIKITVPDTVCIDAVYDFENDTEALGFNWTFGNNAIPSNSQSRSPKVRFENGGPQIVSFSAIASATCQADTFFTVYVEDPSAAFTIDPATSCLDPATYTFTHPQSGFSIYNWYIEELDTTLTGGPQIEFTYDEPTRDTFYISRQDTFNVFLNIETTNGCKAQYSEIFLHRAPRAHFVPDLSRGCAPLTVNFDEVSESTEEIISWAWTFGDGTSMDVTDPDDMTHVYSDPGEYYAQLIIENVDGCRDTSEGVWIYVGEPIESDFTVDRTEICLYESVNFEALNLDTRIDAWHFDTDDGRISDCYETPEAEHTFVHAPGTYPVTLTVEYNGCFNEIDNGQTITVNGSKSIIKFMTNCTDPYTVMFQDSSLNASSSIWLIEDNVINMDTINGDSFNYTFADRGDYVITLITDDDTECPPDTSSVDVYIRDIEAKFELPEVVCAFNVIKLNASESVDVDNTCSKGYEWFGIARRPRQVDYPDVETAWNPGLVNVVLIVEDLNGCKDTLRRESRAIEVDAAFEINKDSICFPSGVSFTDLTVSDTTLVSWEWSFGSTEQNPSNVLFTDNNQEFLTVELVATDELGCSDSTRVSIPTYDITSNIEISPDAVVCLGETIDLTATDYTQGGSFLNYNWIFGNLGSLGTSTEQNPSFDVTTTGSIPITMVITEDSTGCQNQYDLTVIGIAPPVADFLIDVENPEEICPNDIVEFVDQSIYDGAGFAVWDFGNGSPIAVGNNAKTFFGDSTYTIQVIARSAEADNCTDTITQEITLEGPAGDFSIDKDFICIGETVTFTLDEDTSNVANFTWTFGDGSTTQGENPVAHPYTFLPDTLQGEYSATLTLESSNGCKNAITKRISISDLIAAFEFIQDTSNICNKEIEFINLSEGDIDNILWDFGNGGTSEELNPIITYDEPDSFFIATLTVQSNNEICESTASERISNVILMDASVPTVFSPNNDQVNDFFDIIITEEQRACVEVVRAKIFNRWGNLIYDNDLPPEGWNGKFSNGQDAPAEIYTYVLNVEYSTGESEFFKGTFTLIR